MFGRVRKFYDIGSAIGSFGAMAGGPVGMGAAAGLQVVMGIAQGIRGVKLNRQADDMERNTTRPTYRMQQGFIDNQNFAESLASQGLSDAAMIAYTNQANRGLNTSIDAILRGGGDVTSIADLYDTAENDYAKVVMMEEEARLRNAQIYMDTNERTSTEQDKVYQLNVYNPYMDRVAAIDRIRNRAQATSDAGRNMAVGALNNFVTGNMLRQETGFGQPRTMPQQQQFTSALPAGAVNPTSGIPPMAPPSYLPMVPNSPAGYGGIQINSGNPLEYGSYMKRMLQSSNIPVPYNR